MPENNASEMLQKTGFKLVHSVDKVDRLTTPTGSVDVYVDNKVQALNVIFHPSDEKLMTKFLDESDAKGRIFINADMRGFPKKIHSGVREEPYGFKVKFKTEADLIKLAKLYDQAPKPSKGGSK